MNSFISSLLPFFITVTVTLTAITAVQASESSSSTEASNMSHAESGGSLHDRLSAVNVNFEKANQLALENPAEAQKIYQSAVLEYQYLSELPEMQSAELFTNLGNGYYFTGDHGRAVLSYQRALRIDPLLDNARHNLHYLRSLTVDEVPETKSQKIIRLLTFWHRWSWPVRGGVFALSFTCLWVIGAVMYYRRNRVIIITASSLGLISCVFALSLITSQQGWDNQIDGVVLDREVLARQGNGVIYDSAFASPLHAGTEFSVIEQREDWIHAELLDGSRCWIPVKSVALIVQP